MEENKYTDDFLAKWASGNLSNKEQEEFEKSKEHEHFKAILDGTDLLQVSDYDSEALYARIRQGISREKNKKVIPLVPKWVYGVAASIALLLGIAYVFNSDLEYSTTFGEQMAIVLPDGSEVILNAKSQLEHKKRNWENNREISLQGEAYFKVNKGATFTVNTKKGSVIVLGTEFTVNAGADYFQVICYEGEVSVHSNDVTEIIGEGEAVRMFNGSFEQWNMEDVSPQWLQGESSFTNAPLLQVIKTLEKQFGIHVDHKKVAIDGLRFTGSFSHANVRLALRTVFEPMEIKFTFADKNTVVLVQE
ncbi:FecR family protein [Flagellimonas onchidii]|uniref:FecR family protein n=1 Tax=Flagellimonas onchidii TaxID=2562684 RepID=UPI0010A5F52C|nr:FecR domain-containing protein [Allomuricauda onchidii]